VGCGRFIGRKGKRIHVARIRVINKIAALGFRVKV
jgi:hypothetical protein